MLGRTGAGACATGAGGGATGGGAVATASSLCVQAPSASAAARAANFRVVENFFMAMVSRERRAAIEAPENAASEGKTYKSAKRAKKMTNDRDAGGAMSHLPMPPGSRASSFSQALTNVF